MRMTRAEAESFAHRWCEAWNARDIEQVLAHFEENVVFTSPTALAVTGNATVRGKAALRIYWESALSRIHSLQFTIHRVLWDPELNELAILYTSETDGKSRPVSENLRFNRDGRVISAEVFHGVSGEPTAG